LRAELDVHHRKIELSDLVFETINRQFEPRPSFLISRQHWCKPSLLKWSFNIYTFVHHWTSNMLVLPTFCAPTLAHIWNLYIQNFCYCLFSCNGWSGININVIFCWGKKSLLVTITTWCYNSITDLVNIETK
jgi:hypothetical protein